AKTGVHRHQQHHVDLVEYVFQVMQRRGRIEHQAGFAATVADHLQAAVDVLAGFRVEGNVGGTGLNEITDDAVDRLHHQMDVDGGLEAVITQRLAHHGADGQVRHVMIVHHVEVDNVGTRRQHGVNVLTQ